MYSYIPEHILECERIAGLTGNIGRTVTRQLDRLFKKRIFASWYICTNAGDTLDEALFCVRMQEARGAAEQLSSRFSISVQITQIHRQVRVVVIPLSIPDGVRARQALLAEFARVMRVFSEVAHATNNKECLQSLRARVLEGKTAEEVKTQRRYLHELVRGDYTNISKTSFQFLGLANVLNPSVDDRLRELLEVAPNAEEVLC